MLGIGLVRCDDLGLLWSCRSGVNTNLHDGSFVVTLVVIMILKDTGVGKMRGCGTEYI